VDFPPNSIDILKGFQEFIDFTKHLFENMDQEKKEIMVNTHFRFLSKDLKNLIDFN